MKDIQKKVEEDDIQGRIEKDIEYNLEELKGGYSKYYDTEKTYESDKPSVSDKEAPIYKKYIDLEDVENNPYAKNFMRY